MIDLAELMRLRGKATPGPWKKMLQSSYIIPICTALHNNYTQAKADAAYIVAACDAVPKLVARIRELEKVVEQQEHRLDLKSKIIAEHEASHA